MTGGRLAIIAVLVVALIATALTRDVARQQRQVAGSAGRDVPVQPAARGISGMNSFALALLLGGLRGPLVMILWSSSEEQKTDRDLADFDTKVEWIRMLQPEFDTVHIFQIWNKAYNISVQMASLANKYSTILDAIDYARSVDAERPNNINIIHAIGSVYFDKLGNSAEKAYFQRRLREESLSRPEQQRIQRGEPGWRRIEHDPLLDENGYILAHLLEPRYERPANFPPDAEWNDGSELQYLADYQPFPYGISAFGLGYNYFKQAQVLLATTRQSHAQLSDMVIDSRAALALKFWSAEERERGLRAELRAFGKPVPLEPIELEMPSADLALAAEANDSALIDRAIFGYEFAARLAREARPEYERHLRHYDLNYATYMVHLNHLAVIGALADADAAYLRAMRAADEQRQQEIESARRHYQRAAEAARFMVLRYYVEQDVVERAFPGGYDQYNVDQLTPQQQLRIFQDVQRAYAYRQQWDQHAEDREEYLSYLQRAEIRLRQLQQAVATRAP